MSYVITGAVFSKAVLAAIGGGSEHEHGTSSIVVDSSTLIEAISTAINNVISVSSGVASDG